MKTTKQISTEAQNGAKAISQSKLCWELTNRSREMLSQEIYHLVMKIALDTLDNHIQNSIMNNRQVIVDKRRK